MHMCKTHTYALNFISPLCGLSVCAGDGAFFDVLVEQFDFAFFYAQFENIKYNAKRQQVFRASVVSSTTKK